MIKTLFNLGVRSSYEEWLQIRIRLCNVITYLIGFMALSFLIVTYVYFRPMSVIPVVALVFCVANPILNVLNFTTASRLVMAMVPISLAVLFTASMTKIGVNPEFGFWGMTLSLLIMPFILFDFKEVHLSILCFALSVVYVLSFAKLNALFEFPLPHIAIIGVLNSLSSITSIITIFFALFWLSHENRRAESRNAELVKSVEAAKFDLEESNSKLKTSMKDLENMREEDARRQWVSKGVSELVQLTRSLNREKVYEKALAFVVKYVDGKCGALFVNDEGRRVLQLKSRYAYFYSQRVVSEIEYGDGLVGQCYSDRQTIYLETLPKDYLKISSGLGETQPKSILITPLLTNGSPEGVLEVAFLKNVSEPQRFFLTKASECLSSFITERRRYDSMEYAVLAAKS